MFFVVPFKDRLIPKRSAALVDGRRRQRLIYLPRAINADFGFPAVPLAKVVFREITADSAALPLRGVFEEHG